MFRAERALFIPNSWWFLSIVILQAVDFRHYKGNSISVCKIFASSGHSTNATPVTGGPLIPLSQPRKPNIEPAELFQCPKRGEKKKKHFLQYPILSETQWIWFPRKFYVNQQMVMYSWIIMDPRRLSNHHTCRVSHPSPWIQFELDASLLPFLPLLETSNCLHFLWLNECFRRKYDVLIRSMHLRRTKTLYIP